MRCLNKLPSERSTLKCILKIDRKGRNALVYYDWDNHEFERYIRSKGFKTAYGSFSDISVLAPALGIAVVNLSAGYYNDPQLCECINRRELDVTLHKVVEIISDSVRKNFCLSSRKSLQFMGF